jgi:NDP-sugar pyrophosphorylase family protein
VRAAVLAGGFGTRLLPYTTVLPKPLVPIGERPILELIFDWLANSGVSLADVCVGHLGGLIETYFSTPGTIPAGLEVRWQREREPLGTAGALALLPPVTDTLLVVNGDVLTDLDPTAMLSFHREREAALTIATTRTTITTELGVIDEHDGRVLAYREKPQLDYLASMGLYLYEPRALTALPSGPCQFPDLVQALLARHERVASFETDARWNHIGTPGQHAAAWHDLHERGLPGASRPPGPGPSDS